MKMSECCGAKRIEELAEEDVEEMKRRQALQMTQVS
jgi:hypothetical protein